MLNLNKNFDSFTSGGSYAVMEKAAKLEKKGKSIIHFEIGQPDFPTPETIVLAGISALKKGYTKYNPPLGIMPLRERLAKIHNVSSHQIAITPSGKTALFAAMSAVLNKGDHVYYPDPGFPTYRILTKYFGCIPQDKITNKTKLIILNSPNNPTGNVMTKKEMHEINKHNSWVITDEIYSHIVYGNYVSYYDICNTKKTILVHGFSKTYSMTGWRIGYLAFPKELEEKMDCFLTHMVGCTATFTQYAALEAVQGSQISVAEMVAEFKKRRDYIIKALLDIPGVICPKPDGAFYVFPDISSFGKTSAEIADYLLKNGVAVLPGTLFGKNGEGNIRLSYATNWKNIKEGIKRMKIAFYNL